MALFAGLHQGALAPGALQQTQKCESCSAEIQRIQPQGTEHEVGRLWIPFAVPALVPVARELAALHAGRPPWLVVIAGVVMILLMKNYQDFQ